MKKKLLAVGLVWLLALALVSTLPSPATALPPPLTAEDGLVGYWALNEGTGTSTSDTSGNGNHGTLTNGPAWVDGIHGKALQFDGVNDYVNVGNSASLKLDNGFTISAWFQTSTTLGAGQSFSLVDQISNSPTSGENALYILAGSNFGGQVKLGIYDGTNNPTVTGTTDVRDGKWHHVVGVWNKGDKLYLYLDGILEGQTRDTITGSISRAGTGTTKIGGRYTQGFNGLIDQVRIYDRALSRSDIATLDRLYCQ